MEAPRASRSTSQLRANCWRWACSIAFWCSRYGKQCCLLIERGGKGVCVAAYVEATGPPEQDITSSGAIGAGRLGIIVSRRRRRCHHRCPGRPGPGPDPGPGPGLGPALPDPGPRQGPALQERERLQEQGDYKRGEKYEREGEITREEEIRREGEITREGRSQEREITRKGEITR